MRKVSLKCSYKTSSNYVTLYWYRQYYGQAQQWHLYKKGRLRTAGFQSSNPRFTSDVSETFTELIVEDLDSALYYCVTQWHKDLEKLNKNAHLKWDVFHSERSKSFTSMHCALISVSLSDITLVATLKWIHHNKLTHYPLSNFKTTPKAIGFHGPIWIWTVEYKSLLWIYFLLHYLH